MKRKTENRGRKKVPAETIDRALELYENSELTVQEIVEQVGISRGTLYKAVKAHNEANGIYNVNIDPKDFK